MTDEPALLFVYGTLMRGEENEERMSGCTWLGAAETTAGWTLYQLDGYPGMVRSPEGSVKGEVWRVPPECWAALDAFEGEPEGLYERVTIELESPWSGRPAVAYVYLCDVGGRVCLGDSWRRR